MTLSALTLTEQGPTNDAGYRIRRGYTNLIWERVFGTDAVPTPTFAGGIAVTNVDALWDQTPGTGAGGWPRFPDGFPTWRAERKVGNAEMQRYRHLGIPLVDGGGIALAQANYGAPHSMGADYLALHARLNTGLITSDQGVADCYVENTDITTLHNLNVGQTIVCQIPAGRLGFGVGQRLIVGNRNFASGGLNRGCSATVVSYVGTTLTATSLGAPTNMTTGSYQELYILQMNFEAGMWITRTNLAPQIEGYWEFDIQLSPGAGHWGAAWFIRDDADPIPGVWPPEVDLIEQFETNDAIRNRVHAAFITGISGTTIHQQTRTYQNRCTNDTASNPKNMTWGTDLTSSFHKYGLEWGPNFLAYSLDDALMRAEFYRWISERAFGGFAAGDPGVIPPRLAFNYALGPPVVQYRPKTLSLFPGEMRIKYARLYTR